MKKILSILFILSMCVSCASKKTKTTDGSESDMSGKNDYMLELNGDSDSNRAGGLRTVYFDYNSAQLSSSTKKTLDENVAFLSSNNEVEIQIEGHTDERGSAQYNLALGEKRAKSVMDYLGTKGISAGRLSHISLGKEKPVEFSHSEEAWAKNRRANFVITKK